MRTKIETKKALYCADCDRELKFEASFYDEFHEKQFLYCCPVCGCGVISDFEYPQIVRKTENEKADN